MIKLSLIMNCEIKGLKLANVNFVEDKRGNSTLTLFPHLMTLHVKYTRNFEIEFYIQLLMKWFHTH